jgi:hypothetical protein
MRWVLLLVAIVGCRRAGETRTRPIVPLDQPSEPAPVVADQPPVELPSPDELQPVDGSAPESAPTGERIELAYVAPAPGARRVRTLTIVSTEQHGDHTQVYRYGYRLTEVVAQLEGEKVAVMRVTAHDAREQIELDGKTAEQKLLSGTYDIDVTHGYSAHKDGQDIGTREQEELVLVLDLDDGNEGGMHKVARTHPLRIGESILLTRTEKELYANGPSVPDPIALTLVGIDGDLVTLRIDAIVKRDGGATIRHREIDRYRVATGALVDKTLETESTEGGGLIKSRTHLAFDTTAW